jgi:hypothetical protein
MEAGRQAADQQGLSRGLGLADIHGGEAHRVLLTPRG